MIDTTFVAAEHPASAAWRELHPECRPAEHISVLKTEQHHSAVYRLEGTGPANTAVIAKRCKSPLAEVERQIYEQILSKLPVSAPRFFGVWPEKESGRTWIFTEDAGDEWFDDSLRSHRILAARWLGRMHTAAAEIAARLPLPDRRPLYYLHLLRLANTAILESFSNPGLRPNQRALLASIVHRLRCTELHWEELHEMCSVLMPTLVHCDFVAKNVRIRRAGGGSELLPFDWENSGFGLPAPDLEGVEIDSYLAIVHERWPTLTRNRLRRVAAAGRLFRLIHFIYWASRSIETSWDQKIVDNRMGFYHAWLGAVLKEFDWI